MRIQIDSDENREFMKKQALGLLEFGKRFPSAGGSSFYLGDDGTPLMDKPRETWITARMVHVYSIGAMLGVPGARRLAEEGLKGLLGELYDTANEGWYPGINADGSILPDKECYAHAFVMLAASSAYLAGINKAPELLVRAEKVYDKYFWDEEEGMACDLWNTSFSVCSRYRGLNANMHSVEAFLAVADATGDIKYRKRAGRIIERVTGWATDNDYRLPEHFDEKWEPEYEYNCDNKADQFKPYGATPGHGIEWARLIVQWAQATFADEKAKEKYIDVAVKLYDRAVADGWRRNGEPGIAYTTDWKGIPVVTDRMHWTLAEAINTSACLYRVTNDERFANDYGMFAEYLDEKVIDKLKGSWYHQLDDNNRVLDTVWPGKPDLYHAFQAMIIPYSDAETSIAAAVAKKKGQIW